MRVEVYFNLHKKVFSVRSVMTGRVILHTDKVHISNPKFVVRKSGRDKVLRERKKNVHAFVRGDATYFDDELSPMSDLAYNPYKYASFVDKHTEQPVYAADRAYMYLNEAGKPVIKAHKE
jgi:hypothetical protein